MAVRPPPPTSGRWKPGQSGNPGGRTKTAAVADLARQHTGLAISTLAEICGNTRAAGAARVAAAVALLDRGHGKAPVTINHQFDPNQLTDAELAAIAAGSGVAAAEEAFSEVEPSGVRH